MGRPTKKETASKKKLEADIKRTQELAKKQEEFDIKTQNKNLKKEELFLNKSKKSEESISEFKNNETQNNDIQNEVHYEKINDTMAKENNLINDSNSESIKDIKQSVELPDNDIPDDVSNEMDIPDDIVSELGNINNDTSSSFEMPDDDFDPLKEKVIKRSYTDGNLGSKKQDNTNQNSQTNSSGNADGGSLNNTPHFIEPEIAEPIIKPTEPLIQNGDEVKEPTSATHKVEQKVITPVNPKLQDLSATQKKKAAEKTADALITTYANLVPIPFKKISSFNMRKLEKRHINDEIDMHMKIIDDGTTVRDYCESVNEQAEEIFVITKDMQDEIREPLIDVLLENNFALTPTQNLIMIVGGQIVQMGISAIQLMQQNSDSMSTFKKFHEENKADRADTAPITNESNFSERVIVNDNSVNNHNPSMNNTTSKMEDVSSYSKNVDNDIPIDKEADSNSETTKITVEEFLSDETK